MRMGKSRRELNKYELRKIKMVMILSKRNTFSQMAGNKEWLKR